MVRPRRRALWDAFPKNLFAVKRALSKYQHFSAYIRHMQIRIINMMQFDYRARAREKT